MGLTAPRGRDSLDEAGPTLGRIMPQHRYAGGPQ
jgi:hypothetical protein